MKAETRLAFVRYKEMLEKMGVKASNKVDTAPTSLEHLLWMCNFSIHKIDTDEPYPIDKLSRWLGYIQGCLISKGVTTVNNERDITRPWFKKEGKDDLTKGG